MTQNTTENIAAAIKASLPRRQSGSLVKLILAVCTIAGFIYAVAISLVSSADVKVILSIVVLIVLLTISLGYLVFKEIQGLDRYPQAIPHLHFAAHITRDALVSSDKEIINTTVTRLIGSCAEVFSVITGRMCYVNVKVVELDEGGNYRIKTFEADDIANMGQHGVAKALINRLSDYDFTDVRRYYSLQALISGEAATAYLSNDLYNDFEDNRYYHPILFDPRTGQQISNIKKLRKWSGWPLTFRSTLVVPIRFIKPCSAFDLLGFVCVDCGSRNRFDPRLAPDLAGSYADLIFALYHHARTLGAQSNTPMLSLAAEPEPT